jgi:hypothetical protein
MRDGHYNRERGAHALLIMAAAIFIVMIVAGIGLNAARYYLRKTELRSLTRVLALEGGNALPNPIAAVRAVHIFWRIQQRDLSNADMPVKFPTVTLTTFVHSGGGDRVKVLPDDKIGADLGGGTDSANLHYPNPTGARIELPVKYLTVRLEEKFPIFPLPFFPEDHAGVPITTVSIAAEAVAYMPPTDIVLVVESSGSLISPLASDSATNGGDSALAQFFSQPFSYAPNHSLSDSTATIPGLSDRYGSTCKDLAAGVSDAQCKMVVQRLLEQCYGESALNLKRAATLLYDLLAASGTYRVGVVHTVSTFSEQAPITVPLWTHPNLRRCEEDANTHINDTTINYGPPGLYDSVHKKFDCLNPTLKNLGGFGIDVDPNQGIGDPSATEYHPVTLEQPIPALFTTPHRVAPASQISPFQMIARSNRLHSHSIPSRVFQTKIK